MVCKGEGFPNLYTLPKGYGSFCSVPISDSLPTWSIANDGSPTAKNKDASRAGPDFLSMASTGRIR